MPRICIDCRYVGARPSGIGEMVAALAEHAPALAPDLDFLLLAAPEARLGPGTSPNVSVRTVRVAANGPAGMWLLPRITDLSGIDLFHAPANVLPAGLAMPCVTTIHDLMWLDSPELCHSGRLGWLERAFYRHGLTRAIRASAAIATVSEATRQAILAHAPEADGRVHVTRSGVSPDFRATERDPAALGALGIDPGRRYVLTVGQNAPYKNHAGALRAFALAFPGEDDIDLVFVQRRGADSAALVRLAADFGMTGRVRFTGPVTRGQLVQLYSSALLLLHPSLCEGFGNPLAEAMACGCPIVTSDLSAMPEVTGGAALLAAPRDRQSLATCLRRLIEEPELASAMRAKGRVRAAELRWPAFAAANVAIYRRLLG